MEVLTPKLSVRHLNKSFDGKQVLNDLSFDLMEGEFLSILGPSGCGKTTLLRILIGLEQADSGEIWKGGKEISEKDIAAFKLSVKFPFLITDDKAMHAIWDTWFVEANKYILSDTSVSLRNRLLQYVAAKKCWWLVAFYYKMIYKVVYGIIYK